MWQRIPQALGELAAAGARVVVVSGSGNSFASGADLDELHDLKSCEAALSYWQSIRECLRAVYSCELPVIAMIRGSCLGGGFLLALAADLRYATADSTFCVPVAKIGVVLDDENVLRLASIAGEGLTRQLLFLGESVSADKAQASGLINDVFAQDELEPQVLEKARWITANHADPIRLSKKVLVSAGRCGQVVTDAEIAESYIWRS